MEMISNVNPSNPENIEGMAAKFYFQQFHPGLVRRNDDPINSVLNYGYAIRRIQFRLVNRNKTMRILVLLNPTNKRGTKAAYTELRKFLVKDGYILLQSEVFMRITNNRKGAEKHLNRIKKYIPDTGTVRILHKLL